MERNLLPVDNFHALQEILEEILQEKKGENFAQCYQLNCILKIHIFPYFLSYLLSGCSGDYNHHLNLKRSISD